MKKSLVISFVVFLTGVCSCSKVMPAGFWSKYKTNFLVENISDQGPWGGYRALYWKADISGQFLSPDVTAFATKNGWELVDSMDVNTTVLKKWHHAGQPIFPLSMTGLDVQGQTASKIPRWIDSSSKLYTFKTDILIITNNYDGEEVIDVNGFILLSDDGHEMSVYHSWGE